MNRIIIAFVTLTVMVSFSLLLFKSEPAQKVLHVGIVLPIQHAALDDIVAGFKEELKAKMGDAEVEIQVQNALGDANLQRSMIAKFLNDKVDLLVPVATGTTQMTVQMANKEQPVLFLAANIRPNSDATTRRPDLMGIVDEIPLAVQFEFLKKAIPGLTKISLVYSASDKMLDDVKQFEALAGKNGISLQRLMIQNLSDLYTISRRIEGDSQGIFILKDNLVASGINTLVQQAGSLKIPLITSDEGTVRNGAAIAIGVIEADIGRQGARLAAKFLKQEETTQSIETLDTIKVFVNSKACLAQGVDKERALEAAVSTHLPVVEG